VIGEIARDRADEVVNFLTYDGAGKGVNFVRMSTVTTLLYTGDFQDAVTGYSYLRARWMNATTSRFNRLDPMSLSIRIEHLKNIPLNVNEYSYAWSNPSNLKDPNGMFILPLTIGLAATAGIGLAIWYIGSAMGYPNVATAGSIIFLGATGLLASLALAFIPAVGPVVAAGGVALTIALTVWRYMNMQGSSGGHTAAGNRVLPGVLDSFLVTRFAQPLSTSKPNPKNMSQINQIPDSGEIIAHSYCF